MTAQNDKLEKGLAQPLLTSTEHEQDDDGDQECDASEEAPEESRQPANSLGAAYRLLTPSVKVIIIRQTLVDLCLSELLDLPISAYKFSEKRPAICSLLVFNWCIYVILIILLDICLIKI